MSWTNVASVAQLAASLALILRFLAISANPTEQTTSGQSFERTTYIVPLYNDSDYEESYEGNSRMPRTRRQAKPRRSVGRRDDRTLASIMTRAMSVTREWRMQRKCYDNAADEVR